MANNNADAVGSWGRPVELSFPLPKAPDTRVYLQLTIQSTSILLFLTTAMNGDTSTATALGSFVYALPDVKSSFLMSESSADTIHSGLIPARQSQPLSSPTSLPSSSPPA